jgi:hypothetical protein
LDNAARVPPTLAATFAPTRMIPNALISNINRYIAILVSLRIIIFVASATVISVEPVSNKAFIRVARNAIVWHALACFHAYGMETASAVIEQSAILVSRKMEKIGLVFWMKCIVLLVSSNYLIVLIVVLMMNHFELERF